MAAVRGIYAVTLSGVLAACAIHPLPENVTGVKTTQIVHRIRCEARDALLVATENAAHGDQQALKEIGIVYSFSLQGTETDGFTPSATFIAPVANGAWTFNPSAGDTVSRQNVRTFTIVDNYQLLQQMKPSSCEAMPKGPNYQYPIIGRIGIDEMIKTFVALAAHAELGVEQGPNVAQGNKLDTSTNGPPTMVDTISFTTTLTAGVTPTLALTPVGTGTQLTGAALGIGFTRMDVHQVIVGLALPAPIIRSGGQAQHSLRTMQVFAAQPRPALLISAAAPRSSAEQAALEAVNNQIIRFQIPKPLIVTP